METKPVILNIPLKGVDSEHCAMIVDKGLGDIENISRHHVELNNHQAVVETSEPLDVLPLVLDKIQSLGYGVETVKATLPVTGMSCASCAVSVESVLRTLPGVLRADVNFASSAVLVEYVPGIVSTSQMKTAVQSAGYDLVAGSEESSRETLDKLHRAEYKKLLRNTIGAIILALPVVVIGMFFMDIPYANEIMWVLSTPVILVSGSRFFINAWKQAKHRSANMDTLVALSTGVAYLFSVFNTVYPQFWHSRGLHAHVYFEAAAVVIAFILLGKLLEARAKASTSSALKKLIGLQPATVIRVDAGGNETEIPVAQVLPGDILLVKPGDKIPVDGRVTSGETYINESMITGEPVPVLKKEDDAVFAGTINQRGSIYFRAEKVGSATVLGQIIRMVEQAQGSKARVQKLVDRIAAIFVPVVLGIAVLSLLVWGIAGGEQGWIYGVMAMVTVLVIACPCALGLATPTAIMAGVGKGAENGILIRDAEALEQACRTDVLVLDKTGTITEGKPSVTVIYWLPGVDSDQLSVVLSAMEAKSEHPLAEAIVAYFGHSVLQGSFDSITGKGISAVVDGKHYRAGSRKWMNEEQVIITPEMEIKAEEWLQQAHTVIWFAEEQRAVAAVAIADQVREGAAEAIHELQDMGIEVVMLTGDNPHTAAAVAARVNIREFEADMLPADKAARITAWQEQGKVVAMTGDGINDSHALAQADVSIAMGKGTDIAMDVAKMTLISSDLRLLPKAIRLSRYSVRLIRQNLFWAFIYNVIGIPLAAGILYPFTGFLLNPMIAGAAMALSSVSVVANSLRLKWKKLS